MSISTIAISADIEPLKRGQLFDKDCSKGFPGSCWNPLVKELLEEKGLRVLTADMALELVQIGSLNAASIGVVQHLDDSETEALIAAGAMPLLILAFESPLYVPDFYRNAHEVIEKFEHCILFRGLIPPDRTLGQDGHVMRFPIYHQEDLNDILPWSERKFLSMVVANKYALLFSRLYLRHPVDLLRYGKRRLVNLLFNRYQSGFDTNQALQDQRLEAIFYFGGQNRLRLYGKGWEQTHNLPIVYRKKLDSIWKAIDPIPVDEKISTIAKYRFSLCFENYSYPGYVTEKIIECFVAGTVPVYLGAPDIDELIPKEAYVDVRDYPSWESLLKKLESMSEGESMAIIEAGRQYLASSDGMLHSYEQFSSFISQLVFNGIEAASKKRECVSAF